MKFVAIDCHKIAFNQSMSSVILNRTSQVTNTELLGMSFYVIIH